MSQGQNGAELRLVTPGSAIGPVSGRRVGTGALIQGDEIIATRVGHVRERHGTVSVDPVASCYMPRSGDLVIGTVVEARSNLWFLDINGPFQALLPMSLAPWKVEFGGTRDHADINDSLLMRVQEVDEVQNVVATMKGIGLRRLAEGAVLNVDVQHIDTLRAEGAALLKRLRDLSDCRLVLADNGRLWADGDAAGIDWLRALLRAVAAAGRSDRFEAILDAHAANAPNQGDA